MGDLLITVASYLLTEHTAVTLLGMVFLVFVLPRELRLRRRHHEMTALVDKVLAGELTASEYQTAGGDPDTLRRAYLDQQSRDN